MTTPLNPILLMDGYKADHRRQYPEGTTRVYSNLTPRGSKYANGVTDVVWWALQSVLIDLKNRFDEGFFGRPREDVLDEYQEFLDSYLGPNDIGVDHIGALHDLGYLPLRFRALPEGIVVPFRVPVFTVENTVDEFFWLVNYLETYLSAQLWLPITSASTANRYRRLLDHWAKITSDTPEAVDFQAHDFSFRGLSSVESASSSAGGHLLSFVGTDTVPALGWLKHNYNASGPIGMSVAATEHSVMSAGGKISETETFSRLLDLYPTGIVSVVSDTWDLWHVLDTIVPKLKDRILARDGKLVIRPDSGDPVAILCGDSAEPVGSPAYKGVIEMLWDTFGGEVNSKGYKALDSHIGAIYGDSITFERAQAICEALAEKGFATTNVVFGIGSFTYQYVTRDTLGFAMKATWAMVNGEGRNLFKDPVTDDGLKKSATGRLAVFPHASQDGLVLVEDVTPELENSRMNLLRPVWEDGEFLIVTEWDDLLARVDNRIIR